MTQDELNKVTQDVIAELKKNGTNIADASVVSDISQVNNLVAYGKDGKVIKVTPRTIQESVVKHVAWNDSSRLNDFTTAGVYEITGERKMSSEYDNLPIDNSGGGHTIFAILEVLDSSIDSTTNSDDKCITQKLTLSNRVGGDGNVYIRTGRGRTYDSITWEKWGTLQTNINVGQVGSLDEFVDNGIYSGVWADGSSFAQTFVMVVINDYAVAGDNKTIVQYKYAYDTLKGNGEPTYSTRSLHNGVWSNWEDTQVDDDLGALKEELLSRIQGRSENSDAVKDPFKFIGNYDSFESLIEKLDTMHNVEGVTGSSVHNGHFRAMVGGSKLVEIFNEVQGYAYDVWSQRITCAGIVLRNDVVKTETSYSEYSDKEVHKYRQHRYVQKFVDAVSGSTNFDIKGGVKTFCRRHHLTSNNVSTWTPWYDVENPYVQTQNYGKKIALFGASFAQNFAVSGYEFTHEGTSYKLADYIAEKLGAVAFDDYAVGSQGMRCDDNSPFPVHLMNQLKTSLSKGIYDIYIIMGGVNDYWCDKVPLGESTGYASGSSDDEEQNISYCGGLLKAIDYIRVNAPNAKIYTITPFKGYNAEWGWNPRTKIRNAYGNSFYEFVQAQKEVSQIKGVPCLDLWAMQGFSGANAPEHYISDLLHPNGNGYYKASEKIVEFVAHGVGSEVVDVQALSTPLDVKITAEIQRAKDAEQANRQLIADLVGESPETLDTIHEISSWILNDETGAAAMAKEINENKNAIAEEVQRAEDAEKNIAGNLEALALDVVELQEDIPNIKNQVARFDGNAFSATANEVNLTTTGVNISKQWTATLPTVTQEKAGVMSAEDKKVLENLYEEAVKFDGFEVEELGDGIGINFDTFDGNSGSIEIPFATKEKAGVMSAADKKALDDVVNNTDSLAVKKFYTLSAPKETDDSFKKIEKVFLNILGQKEPFLRLQVKKDSGTIAQEFYAKDYGLIEGIPVHFVSFVYSEEEQIIWYQLHEKNVGYLQNFQIALKKGWNKLELEHTFETITQNTLNLFIGKYVFNDFYFYKTFIYNGVQKAYEIHETTTYELAEHFEKVESTLKDIKELTTEVAFYDNEDVVFRGEGTTYNAKIYSTPVAAGDVFVVKLDGITKPADSPDNSYLRFRYYDENNNQISQTFFYASDTPVDTEILIPDGCVKLDYLFGLSASKPSVLDGEYKWSGLTFKRLSRNDARFRNVETRVTELETLSNDWSGKVLSTYGDSVTALQGGDFSYPYNLTNTQRWGNRVADYFEMSKHYGRGIGGQKYAWGTNGGSITWVYKDTGIMYNRNDAFNLDNWDGSSFPTAWTDAQKNTVLNGLANGTMLSIRGCACSWLRITSMYPASIKDSIDAVFVMFHNDSVDGKEFSWVEGDTTDPEWAASEEYATYGGDYNISTLEGGIASTIMKLQAWLPNAVIILGTPINGQGTTGQLRPDANGLYKQVEHVKNVGLRFSIPVIDVYATCGINGLNRTDYITDNIHPYSVAGSKMVARAIIGGFKTILPKL